MARASEQRNARGTEGSYFQFPSGSAPRVHMWPPFQLINSRPQVHEMESSSRLPKGILTFVSFQTNPHSHFLISVFMTSLFSLSQATKPAEFPEVGQAASKQDNPE